MANKIVLRKNTPGILGNYFKTIVLSMLKELKKHMEKELWEKRRLTQEENQNVNRRERNYKKESKNYVEIKT